MLLDGIYARGEVAEHVGDRRLVHAMLSVESALAGAAAAGEEIPAGAAAQIAHACSELERFDLDELARSTAEHATPVVGLVSALRELLPADARDHVHAGATSQDIVDTALMLVVHRALVPLGADLDAAARALAGLADAHRHTPMIARTLLQQALPTTFGLVAAGWLDGLEQARSHLRHIRDAELAVQMGGPVGARPPQVAGRVAATLGLAVPVLGWATIRVRPGLLASVLGVLSGVVAKIARDVTLLAQSEVGELREERAGGSSAMAHKRNPVAAVSALACAKRTPGLVATMLAAMEQEDQRAAGAWQAEWGTLCELLTLSGSALAWLRECVEGVAVDAPRMAANLAAAPTADAPVPAGVDELIDRVLAAHAQGALP